MEVLSSFFKKNEKNACYIQTYVLNYRMTRVFRRLIMAISQDNKTDAGSKKPVRDRLLDVAEELFCERGFEGTRIRELATVGGCNIASVNYYFGGKELLYIEVWRRILVRMRDARLTSIRQVMSQSDASPSLEDLLRSFATAFIGPLMDETKGRSLLKLMAREMLDQHLPAKMLVEEVIKPTMAAMQQALPKACPGLEESKVPLMIFSIAGQLVHAIRVKAMFEQTDNGGIPGLDLTDAVDHIVKFSAAGIRAYTEGRKE
jgi:AcrR family transcriptional regulator